MNFGMLAADGCGAEKVLVDQLDPPSVSAEPPSVSVEPPSVSVS